MNLASGRGFSNKGGITVGLVGHRNIQLSKKLSLPLKTSLIVNPNYQNIAKYSGTGFDPGYNGLGRNPINFVITLTF